VERAVLKRLYFAQTTLSPKKQKKIGLLLVMHNIDLNIATKKSTGILISVRGKLINYKGGLIMDNTQEIIDDILKILELGNGGCCNLTALKRYIKQEMSKQNKDAYKRGHRDGILFNMNQDPDKMVEDAVQITRSDILSERIDALRLQMKIDKKAINQRMEELKEGPRYEG
jgi:hypothetical protein